MPVMLSSARSVELPAYLRTSKDDNDVKYAVFHMRAYLLGEVTVMTLPHVQFDLQVLTGFCHNSVCFTIHLRHKLMVAFMR